MNYDEMCELTAAVINKAVCDGALTPKEFKAKIKNGEQLNDIPYEEFVAEARGFVEEFFEDRQWMLNKIKAYWDNPYCKDCGQKIPWPREWCFTCKSPDERRAFLNIKARRHARLMDL